MSHCRDWGGVIQFNLFIYPVLWLCYWGRVSGARQMLQECSLELYCKQSGWDMLFSAFVTSFYTLHMFFFSLTSYKLLLQHNTASQCCDFVVLSYGKERIRIKCLKRRNKNLQLLLLSLLLNQSLHGFSGQMRALSLTCDLHKVNDVRAWRLTHVIYTEAKKCYWSRKQRSRHNV